MNTALTGVAIVGGIAAGVAVIPIALGFGTAGVVGGSIAAGIQSGIGNVVAGSLFAICQSLGMTGFFTSAASTGATVAATAIGAAALI